MRRSTDTAGSRSASGSRRTSALAWLHLADLALVLLAVAVLVLVVLALR